MAIPLLDGNDFAEMGDRAVPAQAIVNEEFVRRYLNGADAIGRRIQTRAGSFAISAWRAIRSTTHSASPRSRQSISRTEIASDPRRDSPEGAQRH